VILNGVCTPRITENSNFRGERVPQGCIWYQSHTQVVSHLHNSVKFNGNSTRHPMRQGAFTLSQRELQRVSVISAYTKRDMGVRSPPQRLRAGASLAATLGRKGPATLPHAIQSHPSPRRLSHTVRQRIGSKRSTPSFYAERSNRLSRAAGAPQKEKKRVKVKNHITVSDT